jgi:hypothetical protein
MSTTHGSRAEETTVHISLFLITLPRTSKSHEILKLRSLSNIAIRVEAYKAQTSLTQCYNCGHVWANCKQPPRCMWCGAATCAKSAWKRAAQHRYGHAGTASWWTERNLILPYVEAAGTPEKRCERESRREHLSIHPECCSLPTTPPQVFPQWWHCAATHDKSSSLSRVSRPHLHRPAPPPLKHNPHQVPSQSVQAPNANSSPVNDMYKVVARIFQRIMTEHNGTKSEEDRIITITKTV